MELIIETYKATAQKYLTVCKNKGLDKDTLDKKIYILSRLQTFLGDKTFNPDTVNEFIQSLTGLSKSSIDLYGRIIRGFVSSQVM